MKRKIKKILMDFSKKFILFRKTLRSILYLKNSIKSLRYRLMKIDEKLVVFESYMGRSYSCSPKAIYEEMIKDPKYKNFKLVWAFKEPKEKEQYFNHENTTLVKYRSKEYYKTYGQAKYFITNSRLPQDVFKKKNQIYIQCWHGTPLKKLGHDIIDNTKNAMNTKKEIEKKYDYEIKKIDYFISPSKFASKQFTSAFNMKNLNKENVILELGYPRNDFLLNYTEDDVKKVKQKLNIPLNKKVVFYAPTWRDDQHKSGVGYTYQNILNFDLLKKQLDDEYIFLYRPHYLVQNNLDYKKYNNFVIDVKDYEDVNDLYIISDILITDYSSVLFDYANLKRPMIFYMYDKYSYENDLRGFYFDTNELPGKIVTTEQEIINIMDNLKNYNKEHFNKYNQFNQKFNYLDDGNATKRIIDEIFNK